MTSIFYTTPLGIEAIPSAPIFAHIHHAKRRRLAPWAVNAIVGVICFAACAFGFYARFYM